MSYKVLIVGCGAQGRVISTYMARSPKVSEIRLTYHTRMEPCKQHLDWLKSDKISLHRVDANKMDEVASLAKGVGVVVNAVEPSSNLSIMDAALKNEAHYIDLAFGPPYENLDRELERSDKFKDAGRTAITGAGGSPGISNVLAAYGADRLDRVDSISIRCYEALQSKEPISTWSPATWIADCAEPPAVFENGKLKRVPPFSGEEVYPFPDIGPQRVYNHVHEEVFTLPRFIGKGIKNVDFKMATPDFPMLKALMEKGLLSDKLLDIKGVKIAPRDIYLALTPPSITLDELRTKIKKRIITDSYECVVVEISGEKEGKSVRYTLTLPYPSILAIQKTMPCATYESYVVGIAGAILAEMLSRKEIKTNGVISPECLEPTTRQKFLNELSAQNPPIKVYEKVERRLN